MVKYLSLQQNGTFDIIQHWNNYVDAYRIIKNIGRCANVMFIDKVITWNCLKIFAFHSFKKWKIIEINGSFTNNHKTSDILNYETDTFWFCFEQKMFFVTIMKLHHFNISLTIFCARLRMNERKANVKYIFCFLFLLAFFFSVDFTIVPLSFFVKHIFLCFIYSTFVWSSEILFWLLLIFVLSICFVYLHADEHSS